MSKTGGLSAGEVKSSVLIIKMAQSMLTYSRATVTLGPCGPVGRRMCCRRLVGQGGYNCNVGGQPTCEFGVRWKDDRTRVDSGLAVVNRLIARPLGM
jgi:hypothetical protein